MVDHEKIKSVLTDLLTEVAAQARQDALEGESNIGSIYDDETPELETLSAEQVQEAIANINAAAATKAGARRLINGIMVAAKTVANIYFPPQT